MTTPLRLAVLISGGGRTLGNLLARQMDDTLAAAIHLVVANNPDSPGIGLAESHEIDTRLIDHREFASAESFSQAVFDACREAQVDLVVMAGWLRLLVIPPDFENRVINIHPSLLPAFGGKGFYGLRVHRAVLDSGAERSGCTVHLVDNQYDHGPVLHQREVPVEPDDTAESLAARVFAAECEAYPFVINQWAAGQMPPEGTR